jgi:hypothetical protein
MLCDDSDAIVILALISKFYGVLLFHPIFAERQP